MTESPSNKAPLWSWLLLLLPVLALLGYTFINRAASPGDMMGDSAFDPGPIQELELKGVPADGATSWADTVVPTSPPMDEKLQARGKELFAKGCVACHGEDGKGEGILVTRLNFNSRPANLTLPIASIKLRSTQKGTLPLDTDVFRTLTRGLPGTAMLSFRELPEADRWALVHRVMEFWVGGKKWPAAVPLESLKVLPKDKDLVEEGRQQFGKWCQNCHGSDGLGATSFAFQMQRVYPGVTFARGGGKFMLRGSKPEDIVRTLQAGFSGLSPMMSFQPTFYGDEPNDHDKIDGDKKLWGTAYYVRKLIDDQIK